MITIKPGSHIHTILTILTLVGEFPMASLGLLGSVRSYGDLIRKLTTVQEFRLPDSKERIQCRLLTVSGKGKRKTLRFFRLRPVLWSYFRLKPIILYADIIMVFRHVFSMGYLLLATADQ